MNDGGPAFSSDIAGTENQVHQESFHDDMSLRDYFAGMALSGILADPKVRAPIRDCVATAYIFADAMLVERNKETAK